MEKRKYYCEREVELNKRLTDDVYIDVQPVRKFSGGLLIGGEEGKGKTGIKNRGINYTQSPIEANSILYSVCSQCITLKQVAKNLNISEKQVKQHLHKEF